MSSQVRDELYRIVGNKPIIRGTTWIKSMVPSDNAHVARLAAYLDPGESEAIALALELNADYLIIDEYQGRAEATKLGIPIVGLLGDLIAAKKSGHNQCSATSCRNRNKERVSTQYGSGR